MVSLAKLSLVHLQLVLQMKKMEEYIRGTACPMVFVCNWNPDASGCKVFQILLIKLTPARQFQETKVYNLPPLNKSSGGILKTGHYWGWRWGPLTFRLFIMGKTTITTKVNWYDSGSSINLRSSSYFEFSFLRLS